MIARVFPRITKATPRDEYCFFGPPGMFLPEIDEVHVSVAFTYDKRMDDLKLLMDEMDELKRERL